MAQYTSPCLETMCPVTTLRHSFEKTSFVQVNDNEEKHVSFGDILFDYLSTWQMKIQCLESLALFWLFGCKVLPCNVRRCVTSHFTPQRYPARAWVEGGRASFVQWP